MAVSILYLLITMDKKEVFLTYSVFDFNSKFFVKELKKELIRKNISVYVKSSSLFKSFFGKNKTYDICIAFVVDKKRKGSSILMNQESTLFNKIFGYNLSINLDNPSLNIRWETLQFVSSNIFKWKYFFRKSRGKVSLIFIFGDKQIFDNYLRYEKNTIKLFSDEIVRCLRSNFDLMNYQRRVKIAKNKFNKNEMVI